MGTAHGRTCGYRPQGHGGNTMERAVGGAAEAIDNARQFQDQRNQTQKDWESMVVANKKAACEQNPAADGCGPTWYHPNTNIPIGK